MIVLESSIYIEQCYITLFDKKVQYSGTYRKQQRPLDDLDSQTTRERN